MGATPSSGTSATCTYASATTVVVVMAGGTVTGASPGVASSVELTFTNGAKVATVPSTPLSMVVSPTATSIDLTAAYAGSTITVTGANFIAGFA